MLLHYYSKICAFGTNLVMSLTHLPDHSSIPNWGLIGRNDEE